MNRYQDPNHHDCWIECPGSGTAVYADPPGRCFTRCGEEGLTRCLKKLFVDISAGATFSISTSVPDFAVNDILSLPFGQLAQQDQYQSVLNRLRLIGESRASPRSRSDFEFVGETTLLELLTKVADHFEGEQANSV